MGERADTGRSVGRPRRYPDAAIFAAIHHVITDDRTARVTLARLAELMGCSAPLLCRRFGSLQRLLLAYLRWCTTATERQFAAAAPVASPLDRLAGTLQPSGDTRATSPQPVSLPHLAALVHEAGAPPLLRTAFQEHYAVVATGTHRLLDEAIAAGELEPVDTAHLARRLLEAVSGAALLSELEGRSSGEASARHPGVVVRDVLAPYRTAIP